MKCVGAEDGQKQCQRCKRANVELNKFFPPLLAYLYVSIRSGVSLKSIVVVANLVQSALFYRFLIFFVLS